MRLARLPAPLTRYLNRRCAALAARTPDRMVNAAAGTPYLARWYIRPPAPQRRADAHRPALYLHGFYDDDVGHLHDHPWPSVSVIVAGEYIEHIPAHGAPPNGPTRAVRRRPGDFVVRRARSPHRIALLTDQTLPVLTLFAVGQRRRDWGFWCAQGWREGRAFKRIARERGDPAGGCE